MQALADFLAVFQFDLAQEGDFQEAAGDAVFKGDGEGDLFALEQIRGGGAGDGVAFFGDAVDADFGDVNIRQVDGDVVFAALVRNAKDGVALVKHGVNVEFPIAESDHSGSNPFCHCRRSLPAGCLISIMRVFLKKVL